MQTQLTLFDYMTKNLENTVKNLEKRTIAYLLEEKKVCMLKMAQLDS